MRYRIIAIPVLVASIAAFAFVLSKGSERRLVSAPAVKGIARGHYETPPPGIDSVKGECIGKIALTPEKPRRYLEAQPYPVVYDCASKTFEVLNRHEDIVFVADLTLTKDGYYLHQSKITDGIWGGITFMTTAVTKFADWNGQMIPRSII